VRSPGAVTTPISYRRWVERIGFRSRVGAEVVTFRVKDWKNLIASLSCVWRCGESPDLERVLFQTDLRLATPHQ